MSQTHPNPAGNTLDRKHYLAIADLARAVLQPARAFLDATRFGKGTPLSDDLYAEWEDSLHALRRFMSDANCFHLHKRYFPTRVETRAFAALRTLAPDVGESPRAPPSASALPPLPNEESIAHLTDFVAAVEAFLPAPQAALAEQTDPVSRAIALMLAAEKEGKPVPAVKDLLHIVGGSRTTLYRDPQFRAARKALKARNRASIPRGSKTKEGNLEAGYDPAEE